jgi:hypothetical protein
MSPEVKNASPRLMRMAISASEYWRPAEERTAEDGTPVGRFSGTDMLNGGGGMVSNDDDLVSGGWTVDCSSLIGLLSPVLTAEWRSAGRFAATDGSILAGLSTTVELTSGGGVVVGDDLVSVFAAVCTDIEFATSAAWGTTDDTSSLICLLCPVLSGVRRA